MVGYYLNGVNNALKDLTHHQSYLFYYFLIIVSLSEKVEVWLSLLMETTITIQQPFGPTDIEYDQTKAEISMCVGL